MTETLWKIGNTYYQWEADLCLHKVAEPGLGVTPRRLRKVVERVPLPEGKGITQFHRQKYEVPYHFLPQPTDTYRQQRHREQSLSGHIDQTANLIYRKHGVLVPGSQETPAWLTKRGHAEFINHIHEILDRASDLGVNGFHSYHQRDNDLNSPTGGQITPLSRPRPLVFTFKHHPDFDKALALYDEDTHHIHINQPDELDRPINRFEDYEKIMLADNSRRTQQSSNHRYNRWPQSRGYFAMPEGTVAHELGHAMHVVHSNATGRQWGKDSGPWSNLYRREQSQVLKQLSRYGAKNAPELVAEVFNRLVHHQPVPPEMLQLYHDVGGHPLKVNRIPEPAWRY